jgi:PKD repeat protein
VIWEIVVTAVISLSVSMAVNTTTHPVKAPLELTEVSFTVTPQSGEVPLTVTFEDSAGTIYLAVMLKKATMRIYNQ